MSIQTQEITLSLKDTIEAIRLQCNHETASHAFASLYIWRKDMDLSMYLEDRLFAVRCGIRGKNTWFFPCGDEQAVRLFIERVMQEEDLTLCYMREEDAEFLFREFPHQFQIDQCSADDEYLYDRVEQERLKGRKFSSLRNHINRAKAEHDLYVEALSDKNAADALAIYHAWKSKSGRLGALEDITASEELLRQWKALDVQGVIVRADGAPLAVVAGYPIGEKVFDISLAKQTSRISGLSVYAKHALISALSAQYTLINAEEDLGIAGLRTMKHQMRPIGQIKMFKGRMSQHGDQF